ncbi:MAG TPA: flagellar export chaperone FliS [Spirochaetota bacterium]|nr:flagellar export chaperone FliS [Spirochaetota bacterium]HNT10672.1 flagellar export chaperone FliS [Spirochaetota bacterium]
MAVPRKSPYEEYKKTEINTANQGKLIVMLYDGIVKFLGVAIDNMNPRTYDVVNANIIRAQDIITELMLALNINEGGEISNNLFNLYVYFKKRLLEANIKKDAEILTEVVTHVKELRDAWDKISAKETKTDKFAASKGTFSIEG